VKEGVMRINPHRFTLAIVLVLALPFGCGKDTDDGSATAGSGGVTNIGGQNTAGTSIGGRMTGTSGSGPTGCEGITPMTGDECGDAGLVCPNQRGSCVCERSGSGHRWECFEVGGSEGGADNAGGAPSGGNSAGGENAAGAAGARAVGGAGFAGETGAGGAGAQGGAG
jgi:hypothetical protein